MFHVLLSLSASVVDSDGASAYVSKFVHYLKNISEAAAVLELKRSSLLDKLTHCIQLRETLELAFADVPMCNPGTYRTRAGLSDLKERLKGVLSTIPAVGFNSQRYDLNIMKEALMKELFGDNTTIEKGTFIVKKQDAVTCIQTGNLRILDITNYISPGFSYRNYLKAYGVSEEKGFFPYEWMDCLEKLNETSLPPHSEFYSKLRRINISEDDYAVVVRAWHNNKMKCVRDLLVWYNNLDVKPFLLAIDSHSEIYKESGIDMLTIVMYRVEYSARESRALGGRVIGSSSRALPAILETSQGLVDFVHTQSHNSAVLNCQQLLTGKRRAIPIVYTGLCLSTLLAVRNH